LSFVDAFPTVFGLLMPMKSRSWNFGRDWDIIQELETCIKTAQYIANELEGVF
jgi:hypothetical protein